jgi:hypothetical protein
LQSLDLLLERLPSLLTLGLDLLLRLLLGLLSFGFDFLLRFLLGLVGNQPASRCGPHEH